jgi:hypothetical protein
MSFDVFLLFFNAVLTTVLSSLIVIWILRTQYLPVIKRLERESSAEGRDRDGTESHNSRGGEA